MSGSLAPVFPQATRVSPGTFAIPHHTISTTRIIWYNKYYDSRIFPALHHAQSELHARTMYMY